MKQEVFDDCYKFWSKSDGHTPFWGELAGKWGYPTAESLRQEFKNQKRKKKVSKEEKKSETIRMIVEKNHGAKILCLDIETTPIQAFVWGLWDQNVNTSAIIQDWHLLSWSARWLFSPDVMSDVLTSDEAKSHDDFRICQKVWALLDEADIILTHNGINFDIKKLNTRFVYHNMMPPKPFQNIDTLVVAKGVFGFTSNKLDYINSYLGLPQKTETDFALWSRCFYGDKDALQEMKKYNENDVMILEDTYLKLRPYIKNHPNLNLWSEENVSVCPNCGSKHLNWNGYYYTYTGYYSAFRCESCGATGRSRTLEASKEKRKTIVR